MGIMFFTAPPLHLSPTSVTIEPGAPAGAVAEQLAQKQVITSAHGLRMLLRITRAHENVQSGTYHFDEPQSLWKIAERLTTGDTQTPLVRITFPEGLTVREMAARVTAAFPHITAAEFEAGAAGQEGYLFPDTYLFDPATDAEIIIDTMRDNFAAKLAPLAADIAAAGRTERQIIIMASIIEKEARTVENKRLVSGVLWNRIDRDMPLQVDAVFGYIFKRPTYSPSTADLKVDSPYNTYTHRGLPPGPINNPGLESIDAALHPTPTDYLYYLTGSDDLMHYARTYAEHQQNLRMYLK